MKNNLIVESKILRDAKAGFYEHALRGRVLDLLYESGRVEPNKSFIVSTEDVVILDISFYQRTANFQTMKNNGVSGVIIRAGQNAWPDTCAERFMSDAEAVNMPIGSYWFYDSRAEPEDQAEMWKAVLKNHDTKLRCWADYEENYGGEFKGWRQFYNFLEACKKVMPGRKFGVYTGYYYWLEHSPLTAGELNYFAQYPLWEAWYINDISFVKIPRPWTKMTFWQKTSSENGTKYGVGSLEVDMNLFIGTRDEFNQMFDLDDTGEEPMPEVTYTANIKPTVTLGAIVREVPNGGDTGQRLQAGTRVQITGQPTPAGIHTWYNVISPVTGWVAEVLLENIVQVTPPPTTPTLPDTIYIATREDMSDKVKYVKGA